MFEQLSSSDFGTLLVFGTAVILAIIVFVITFLTSREYGIILGFFRSLFFAVIAFIISGILAFIILCILGAYFIGAIVLYCIFDFISDFFDDD